MSQPNGATATQWKTLGSLSKHLGVRSATVLVASALGREETEVRANGVTKKQAALTITAAIALQAEREKETSTP